MLSFFRAASYYKIKTNKSIAKRFIPSQNKRGAIALTFKRYTQGRNKNLWSKTTNRIKRLKAVKIVTNKWQLKVIRNLAPYLKR